MFKGIFYAVLLHFEKCQDFCIKKPIWAMLVFRRVFFKYGFFYLDSLKCNNKMSFVIFWVFVILDCLSFGTIWYAEFCDDWSFFSFVTIGVLPQLEFIVLSQLEFCHHEIFSFVTTMVLIFVTIGAFEFCHNLFFEFGNN